MHPGGCATFEVDDPWAARRGCGPAPPPKPDRVEVALALVAVQAADGAVRRTAVGDRVHDRPGEEVSPGRRRVNVAVTTDWNPQARSARRSPYSQGLCLPGIEARRDEHTVRVRCCGFHRPVEQAGKE